MAVIDTTNQTTDFTMSSRSEVDFASYVNHSNGFYSYLSTNGHLITLLGGGVTVDGSNIPTGGIIGAITIDLNNDNPTSPDIEISSLGIILTDLDFISETPAFTSLWTWVLDGPTEFITPVNHATTNGSSLIMGDMDPAGNIRTQPVVLGANDILLGGDVANLTLMGDTTVTGNEFLVGGDDTLSGAFNFGIGDTETVFVRLLGGDDLIMFTTNWTADPSVFAVGDASILYGSVAPGDYSYGTLVGGNDTIDASFLTGQTGVNVLVGDVSTAQFGTLARGGDDLILGSQSADSISGDVRQGTGYIVGGNDTLIGNGGDDCLSGDNDIVNETRTTGGNDFIDGGTGNDTLFGNGGDDTLIGGSGADEMHGHSGSDWASYETATAAVRARLDNDANMQGDALGDTLEGIENLRGSDFNDTLIGNAQNNILDGAEGNDILFGGGGNDTLIGGFGADVLHGQSGVDTASFASANIGIGARLDGMAGSGGAAGDRLFTIENLEGSQFDDTLVGDGADNVIAGLDGNDTIFAALGNDTLEGGADDDLLYGQGGDDVLDGGSGNDMLIGGAGADQLTGGAGFDTATYAGANGAVGVRMDGFAGTAGLATGDQLFSIEAVIGTAHGDTIVGSSANNVITGGAGDDVLFASGGMDRLIGGLGADTLHGQNGIDTASYAGAGAGIGARLDGVAGFAGEAAETGFSLLKT